MARGNKKIRDQLNSHIGGEEKLKGTVLMSLLNEVEAVDLSRYEGKEYLKNVRIASIRSLIKLIKDKGLDLCTYNNYIYAFNGKYWEEVDIKDFKFFLAEAAYKMGVRRQSAEDYNFADQLFKQFDFRASLIPPKKRKGKVLINLNNGTLEVTQKGVTLRAYKSRDFLRYKLDYNYDPDAKCPMFTEYLEYVVPSEGARFIMAEFLGFAFTDLNIEKILFLLGGGENGKSVFMNITKGLMGDDNVTSYSLEALTKGRFYAVHLDGKLLNYSGEMSGGVDFDKLKTLASGEPFPVEEKNKPSFDMTDYARLIQNANKMPYNDDHTHGGYRRLLIIPFTKLIPENKKDIDLADKIIEGELSGVLNWVLEGLARLKKNKRFTKDDESEKALEEYKRDSDSVASFSEDCAITRSIEEVPLKSAYSSYREYCDDFSFSPLNVSNFKNRLKDKIGIDNKRVKKGFALLMRYERYSSTELINATPATPATPF